MQRPRYARAANPRITGPGGADTLRDVTPGVVNGVSCCSECQGGATCQPSAPLAELRPYVAGACPPGTVYVRWRVRLDRSTQECLEQAATDARAAAGAPFGGSMPAPCGYMTTDAWRAAQRSYESTFVRQFNAGAAACGLSDGQIKGLLQTIAQQSMIAVNCPTGDDGPSRRVDEPFTCFGAIPAEFDEEECVGIGSDRVFPGSARPPGGWGWHGPGHHRPPTPDDPFTPGFPIPREPPEPWRPEPPEASFSDEYGCECSCSGAGFPTDPDYGECPDCAGWGTGAGEYEAMVNCRAACSGGFPEGCYAGDCRYTCGRIHRF